MAPLHYLCAQLSYSDSTQLSRAWGLKIARGACCRAERETDSLGTGRSTALGALLLIPVGFIGLECFYFFRLTARLLAISHGCTTKNRSLNVCGHRYCNESRFWQKKVIIFLGGSQKQTVSSYLSMQTAESFSVTFICFLFPVWW